MKTLTQELQAAMTRNAPLVMSEKREEDLLQKAGFVHHLETNKTKRKELELLKTFGQFITYEEIKTVGMRYNMGFVHVSAFTGTPGPNTANRIDEFERKYGESKGDRFFILAPIEMIDQQVVNSSLDPVLFYRVGKDRYFLIDQWGGDMTWKRRVFTSLSREPFYGTFIQFFFGISLPVCFGALTIGFNHAIGAVLLLLAVPSIARMWIEARYPAIGENQFDRMHERSQIPASIRRFPLV